MASAGAQAAFVVGNVLMNGVADVREQSLPLIARRQAINALTSAQGSFLNAQCACASGKLC